MHSFIFAAVSLLSPSGVLLRQIHERALSCLQRHPALRTAQSYPRGSSLQKSTVGWAATRRTSLHNMLRGFPNRCPTPNCIGWIAKTNPSLMPDTVARWQSPNASRGGVTQEIFAQPPSVSKKRSGRIRIDEDAGQQFCRVPMGMKKLGIDHSLIFSRIRPWGRRRREEPCKILRCQAAISRLERSGIDDRNALPFFRGHVALPLHHLSVHSLDGIARRIVHVLQQKWRHGMCKALKRGAADALRLDRRGQKCERAVNDPLLPFHLEVIEIACRKCISGSPNFR